MSFLVGNQLTSIDMIPAIRVELETRKSVAQRVKGAFMVGRPKKQVNKVSMIRFGMILDELKEDNQ